MATPLGKEVVAVALFTQGRASMRCTAAALSSEKKRCPLSAAACRTASASAPSTPRTCTLCTVKRPLWRNRQPPATISASTARKTTSSRANLLRTDPSTVQSRRTCVLNRYTVTEMPLMALSRTPLALATPYVSVFPLDDGLLDQH